MPALAISSCPDGGGSWRQSIGGAPTGARCSKTVTKAERLIAAATVPEHALEHAPAATSPTTVLLNRQRSMTCSPSRASIRRRGHASCAAATSSSPSTAIWPCWRRHHTVFDLLTNMFARSRSFGRPAISRLRDRADLIDHRAHWPCTAIGERGRAADRRGRYERRRVARSHQLFRRPQTADRVSGAEQRLGDLNAAI